MVQGRIENGKLIIAIEGTMDSTNAKNKRVALGDTKLDPTGEMPEGLVRFLKETGALGL